ncbi:tachylectin-related carbohydrate-binding protein [Georgenia daeguensis]|uniref:PQQ-binding-like beta-propeller repeat protein n=1 Tax=Georgenia daeguensis TaxID=908355 RepID=A0ABP8EVN3_9MICO
MNTRKLLGAVTAALAVVVSAATVPAAVGATTPAAGEAAELADGAVVGPLNGGFEDGTPGTAIPGWTVRGGTVGGAEVVTDPVFSGAQAARLVDPEDTRSYGLMSDRFAVAAGHAYQVSLQALVESGAPTVYLYFYDAAGTQVGVEWTHFTAQPVGEWAPLAVDATAPEGAVSAAAYVYSTIPRMTSVVVDDVVVTHEHGPLDVTDLGPAFYSPNARIAETDVLADGTPVAYVFSDGQPVSLNVVDLRTGELLDSHDMTGYSVASAIEVAEDDTVYFSVRAPNDGSLWSYDPQDRQVEKLASRIAGEALLRNFVIDGNTLYGSTYPNAKVYSYDLTTGEVRDYGSVTDDGDYAWGFDLVDGELWVGTGTTPHLFRLDPVTGERVEVPLPPAVAEEADFITRVEQHGDLVLISYSPAGEDNTAVYDLTTGQWLDPFAEVTGQWSETELDGRMFYTSASGVHAFDLATRTTQDIGWAAGPLAAELEGTNDLSLLPIGTAELPGQALVGVRVDGRVWRYDPATGTGDVLTPGIKGAPATVHSVGHGADGDIYFGAYLSAGVMARVDTDAGTVEQLTGPKQADSIVAHHNRTVVGSYPGADFHVAKPNEPWEWGTNPSFLLGLGRSGTYGQDRPLTMVSAGGRVAAGTVPNYGELGGALTFFNTDSGRSDVFRNVVQDQSVVALAYRDGLVIGGTSIHGGLSSTPTQTQAELFVWDAEEDRLVTSQVVVEGAEVIHALAFDADGRLWGLAGNGVLFEYDLTTNEVVRRVQTPARAGNTWGRLSELYLHPDGRLYGNADGRLFRFDPDTERFTTLITGSARNSAVAPDGSIYFADETNVYRLHPEGDR